MVEMLIRFILGGLVVSLFAIVSDALRPKSFAGLFGAAPSVALATLGLTVHKNGHAFAALEARSMIAGALGFLAYAIVVSFVLRRYKFSALQTALCVLPLWFLVSFGLQHIARYL
jgi:uncharacterized membrane protein (GlpM family)